MNMNYQLPPITLLEKGNEVEGEAQNYEVPNSKVSISSIRSIIESGTAPVGNDKIDVSLELSGKKELILKYEMKTARPVTIVWPDGKIHEAGREVVWRSRALSPMGPRSSLS